MSEEKLNHAIHLIWRNLPRYPSTFGRCANFDKGCSNNGRGCGLCLSCATHLLSIQVGEDKANTYCDMVKSVVNQEQMMLNITLRKK